MSSSGPYDRYRRSSSTDARGPQPQQQSGSGFAGLNFDFPRINIQNLTQSFTNRNFGTPSSFSNLMSFRQDGQRSSSASRPASEADGNCCDNCGTKFGFLKRRRTCAECTVDFCTSCFMKDNPTNEIPRRGNCRRCRIFAMQPLDRRSLMNLRVRDLRWYLARKRVPAHLCKEKSDLVDLIMQHNGYPTETAASAGRSRPSSRRPSVTTRTAAAPPPDTTPTDSSSADDGGSWVIVDEDDAPREMGARAQPASANMHCDPPEPAASATEVSSSTAEDFKPFNIDDLESEEQVHDLSVRQMKLVLTRNFVDYKGCCEKEELAERVLRLWRERRKNKLEDPDDISDENCCKICMEAPIDCVLLECGHLVTCTNCGKRLNECPICRQYVIRAVRIFKS